MHSNAGQVTIDIMHSNTGQVTIDVAHPWCGSSYDETGPLPGILHFMIFSTLRMLRIRGP